MSHELRLKRRQFLAGAVAAGPALALGATGSAQAAAEAPRAASVPNVPPPEPPVDGHPVEGKPGSDFMVDVIKTLDIDYVASVAASTFRGLHESFLNYGNNTKPEFLTVLHEDVAVGMAHGYAKVSRKPMAAMVHGTVGLQHCAMSIYNAYADRVPIVILSGNIANSTTRMPFVEWNHSALDQNALVRDFTKWDDEPASLQAFADSMVRGYGLATTAPMGPVLVTADGDLQEDPIPAAVGERLHIPQLRARAHPQGDSNAVREAARMLVAAENPVIYVNRYGRTENAPALLVELAELLNAAVIDPHMRMNFPNRHKFNFSSRREPTLAEADVILALEPIELWGLTNAVPDIEHRPNRALRRQPNLKIIHIGTESLMSKSNYADFQRFATVDLSIAGDAEATMPTLLAEVRSAITPARRTALATRGERLAGISAGFQDMWRKEAAYAWDASPISSARMSMELWDQIKNDDWMMPTETQLMSEWPYRLWDITKPYQTIGGSGAQGIGYNTPAAIGAALANKPHGRLTVSFVGDGDFNMAPASAIWTAAHHNIPLLMIVRNNRAYHQEVMYVQAQAARRGRDVTTCHIGTAIRDPNIDHAKIAQGYGVYAEGPIDNPNDLGPALRRALAVVRRGEPALLDVVAQPR
jgi:thiamine pyrophosphate-dependent acetolactate synthase large subunit-like protein